MRDMLIFSLQITFPCPGRHEGVTRRVGVIMFLLLFVGAQEDVGEKTAAGDGGVREGWRGDEKVGE